MRNADDTPYAHYATFVRSERLRITSAGLVGIGTSSPTTTLHVVGSSGSGAIQIGNAVNTQYHYINFGGSASTNDAWQLGRSPSGGIGPTNGFYLYDLKSSATRLAVDTSGNVGIGTTSPAYAFVVSAAGASGIEFGPAYSGTANLIQHYSRSGFVYVDAVNDAAQHRFQISGTERARIDSSGRLLVGTASTSTNLRALIQATSANSVGGGNLYLARGESTPADGASLGYLGFSDSNHTSAAGLEAVRDGGTWTSGSSQPSRLVFSTTADGASSPTERLRITSAGLVGIGTSTPNINYKVTIEGNSSAVGPAIAFSDTAASPNNYNIGINGSKNFFIDGPSAASFDFVLDSSGRVGIGVTSPGTALHLGDSSTLRINNPDGTRTLDLFNDVTNAEIKSTVDPIRINAFHSTGYVRFDTNNQERARINSDGMFQIGATNFAKASTGGFAVSSTVGTGQGAANSGTIAYFNETNSGNGTGLWIGAYTDQTTAVIGSTTATGNIAFQTYNSGWGERMRLTYDGKVGIGTTSPSFVSGYTGLQADGGGNGSVIKLTNSTTGSTSTDGFDLILQQGGSDAYVWQRESASLLFGTAATERARIDSSGRLLVGTSSSAGPALLQVAGNTIPGVIGGFGILDIRHNGFPANGDAVGTIRFQSETNDGAFASITAVADVDGTPGTNDMPGRLVFSTTADGASSPTERMRITSDAYVRLAAGTGGIQFNGDTAAANALDDYEEGTSATSMYGTTTNPTGLSHNPSLFLSNR
jgi:hypothetical protein